MDVEAERRDEQRDHAAGQRDEEQEATAAQLGRGALEFVQRVVVALAVVAVVVVVVVVVGDGFHGAGFRWCVVLLFEADTRVDCGESFGDYGSGGKNFLVVVVVVVVAVVVVAVVGEVVLAVVVADSGQAFLG